MWSFLKNMHLAKLFSYHMESYKELTCEFLASMRYHMYEEEDRADLDQGLGWITFLAKGEKRMVTFRQLEILFGFNYGEGTKWNFKEKELQRVWATIADGVYSSSRSKAAQIRSPVLGVFWSILEHMGHKEHGGTWHMEAAQLDTQRKKGEAILKTSSTVYSTNRSSSSTRPAKLQLDRAEKSTVKPEKCCFPLDFPLTLNLILLYLKALSHEKTTKL
ncbi:unnamed protein product [Microthlaspi erraticum]|uniref:Arabidopsis retrotransposon Orf1 C-terminal domain-containing protein n=2 Tax=Microthlaspi erraticum TaxID=1685480 RepID=A0A6D2K6S1_9BRAS|nr:unnamed protein product [Microthlaspi erraticum]